MPITAVTFIVGWLAIAGVPPFAGFWSKDEILLFSLAKSPALYVVGLVTALLTAYYMTRQVIMVFFGEARWEDHAEEHGAHGEFKPHESPWIMLVPLVVLAVLSIVGGLIQLPVHVDARLLSTALEHWLEPVVEFGEANIERHVGRRQQVRCSMVIATAVAVAGIVVAWLVYQRHRVKADRAGDPRQRLVLRPGGHRLHGRPRARGVRGRRLVRRQRRRRRRQRRRRRRCASAAGELRKGQTGYVRAYAGDHRRRRRRCLLAWFVVVRGIL